MVFVYFYPRSPCGERRGGYGCAYLYLIISIHALLAESDTLSLLLLGSALRFLSTLSLRRATFMASPMRMMVGFLSTLSLRRATRPMEVPQYHILISIHALLAESDNPVAALTSEVSDFYPRSPCGERRYLINTYHRIFGISIHALLAESDRQKLAEAIKPS